MESGDAVIRGEGLSRPLNSQVGVSLSSFLITSVSITWKTLHDNHNVRNTAEYGARSNRNVNAVPPFTNISNLQVDKQHSLQNRAHACLTNTFDFPEQVLWWNHGTVIVRR